MDGQVERQDIVKVRETESFLNFLQASLSLKPPICSFSSCNCPIGRKISTLFSAQTFSKEGRAKEFQAAARRLARN